MKFADCFVLCLKMPFQVDIIFSPYLLRRRFFIRHGRNFMLKFLEHRDCYKRLLKHFRTLIKYATMWRRRFFEFPTGSKSYSVFGFVLRWALATDVSSFRKYICTVKTLKTLKWTKLPTLESDRKYDVLLIGNLKTQRLHIVAYLIRFRKCRRRRL